MAEQDPTVPGTVPAAGSGALRVSHEDRDKIAEVLRVAAGDGRLTSDELDERLERALTARTYDDLRVLITDLPPAAAALSPVDSMLATADTPAAKDLIRLHVSTGNGKRDGRWVVPARMDLKATSGSIRLDFTEAVITQRTLHIDAEVRSGSITLITKPGIVVEIDDVTVRSGSVKVKAPWGDVPVLLRIDIAGKCGSGSIAARPPRRSLWEWLRRAPKRYAIAA
jgi:hypothetical protein